MESTQPNSAHITQYIHSAPFDFEDAQFVAKRKIQVWLDKITPMRFERWIAFTIALGVFVVRIYLRQGYAVLAYLLGLFFLNNIMLFLAPNTDLEEEMSGALPVRENDEYKGFQRKLQEMELWKELMGATVLTAVLSLFESMDIDIYWPLLLVYFVFMSCFLFRFKLEHMVRHKYIPIEIGKKKYSKPDATLPQF